VAPYVGAKNFFINGGMDLWQRGTSFAVTSAAYTADRWQGWSQGPLATVSRQATSDTTNLAFLQYCARVQRNSGQTLTNAVVWQGTIETANSVPLAGKTVTVSFYARAGANFSATSSILNWSLLSGTGTDQIITSFTGSASVISTTATLTTTWQRFQATATVAATATELGFQSYYVPTGTAGANDYFEITGVQLELGAAATPFARAGGSIGGELALCQRYYYRNGNGGGYALYGHGIAVNTTVAAILIPIPVTMRVAPTAVDYSTLGLTDNISIQQAVSNVAIAYVTPNAAYVNATVASGLTATRIMALGNQASTVGFIGLSAEL
jgi:hypothetical protein